MDDDCNNTIRPADLPIIPTPGEIASLRSSHKDLVREFMYRCDISVRELVSRPDYHSANVSTRGMPYAVVCDVVNVFLQNGWELGSGPLPEPNNKHLLVDRSISFRMPKEFEYPEIQSEESQPSHLDLRDPFGPGAK